MFLSSDDIHAYVACTGSLDSSFAEALQVHVAKLVTTPPAGAEAAPFLSNIAEQALDLLLFGLFKNDKVSFWWLKPCSLTVYSNM